MGQIVLIPKCEERNGRGNGDPVEKMYTMEGVEISGLVSPYAVSPLRILSHVLKIKGIDYKVMINGDNPWSITQMLFDDKDADFVKIALEEIMEYRCSVELGGNFEAIIRQLPFRVAMQTSEALIPFPVSEQERKNYEDFVNNPEYIFHVSPPQEMPKDQYMIRKHLIYPSSRGGYNIKTKGYVDSTLNHYCYTDSKRWD